MEELRTGADQVRDELADIYKRMTDPQEQKRADVKQRRELFTAELASDAGIGYNEIDADL